MREADRAVQGVQGAAPAGHYPGSAGMADKVLTPVHEVLGGAHSSFVLAVPGDFAAARRNYENALAVYQEILGEVDPRTASALNQFGVILSSQGDVVEAAACYRRALAIRLKVLGDRHPDTATTRHNLGLALNAQGDFAGARKAYEEALAVYRATLGPTDPVTANALNSLGCVLRVQKHYAEARECIKQALTVVTKVRGDGHPETANVLNSLGVLHLHDDLAAARRYFERALSVYRQALGNDHPDTANTLSNLAAVLRAQGSDAAARTYYEQALAATGLLLEASAGAQSERQQLVAVQHWRHRLDGYLSATAGADEPAEEVYARLLRLRGVVFLRQRLQRQLRASTDPAGRARFAELEATNRQLSALAFAEPDPQQPQKRAQDLADLARHREKLEAALAQRSAVARQGHALAALSVPQLRELLPAGLALVDFLEYLHSRPPAGGKGPWLTERRLVAFVVRAGRPVARCDLGVVAPVAAAVDAWRQRLHQPLSAAADDPARRVHELVWRPLEKHLHGVDKVIVVPDGVTARLPFAAPPGHAGGKYLIEERAVAAVPVPQVAADVLTPAPAVGLTGVREASLLLVGEVDYDAAPGAPGPGVLALAAARSGRLRKWNPLAGARGEVLAIRDSFEQEFPDGKVKMLRGANATEAVLRQVAGQYRFIHLATHGFFAPADVRPAPGAPGIPPLAGRAHGGPPVPPGLLAGVVLAGANRPAAPGQDDGILTALEAAELDLRRCDLVVLSACETGLGETAGGEGVLGLQRAFQVAGARCVAASLWQVPDAATRALMERFYIGLWQRKWSRLEALRQAQRFLLDEGAARGFAFNEPDAGRRLPPHYWAAFVG